MDAISNMKVLNIELINALYQVMVIVLLNALIFYQVKITNKNI